MRWKPKIFYIGSKFTVEHAVQENGDSLSDEFITGLEIKARAKITALIKRFANFGFIVDKTKFKKLEGENLWEFKSNQIRVLMYHCARGVIALTNGFTKQSNKTPKTEIERANRIKSEYENIRKRARHE